MGVALPPQTNYLLHQQQRAVRSTATRGPTDASLCAIFVLRLGDLGPAPSVTKCRSFRRSHFGTASRNNSHRITRSIIMPFRGPVFMEIQKPINRFLRGENSNHNQIWCANTGGMHGFWDHRGFCLYYISPPRNHSGRGAALRVVVVPCCGCASEMTHATLGVAFLEAKFFLTGFVAPYVSNYLLVRT